MGRDDRLTAAARYQREQRRDDQHVALARGLDQRRKSGRQGGDGRMTLTGAAIGAIAMQEIILQVTKDERTRGRVHARSTIRLPRESTRPMCPGSITTVASGCSRIAGPSILVA